LTATVYWALTSRKFVGLTPTFRSNILYPTLFICFWRGSPQWAKASPSTRFLDHTQRRTTVGRTPLDEWSGRRIGLCLTTHNIQNRQKHPCPPWDTNPNLSRRAASDLRLRPHGQWDRLYPTLGLTKLRPGRHGNAYRKHSAHVLLTSNTNYHSHIKMLDNLPHPLPLFRGSDSRHFLLSHIIDSFSHNNHLNIKPGRIAVKSTNAISTFLQAVRVNLQTVRVNIQTVRVNLQTVRVNLQRVHVNLQTVRVNLQTSTLSILRRFISFKSYLRLTA
jgi:hypothetical protein